LSNPKSGWYIHCHTRAIATTEEAYGNRKNARNADVAAPDPRRPIMTARPSATVIDAGTYRAYSSVRPSADQTSGSRKTRP
jgi:hypothetical protein